ncbi:hypothetical protein ACN6LF_001876 [[Kitasatospora] papulosa]|uniref:hypothetical protein n=1 Tax=[Kitasatospora] papulosa TaxID=1464011 RepID=UPI00403D437C
MDLHAWITKQVDETEKRARACEANDRQHVNDPDAVLRRCEADRHVLARHRVATEWTWQPDPACHGCGTEGHCDDPAVGNLNDCPELLDLAHAHGITPEILASLDQPVPPERRPAIPCALGAVATNAWSDALLASLKAAPISDVPAALRGPDWKAETL